MKIGGLRRKDFHITQQAFFTNKLYLKIVLFVKEYLRKNLGKYTTYCIEKKEAIRHTLCPIILHFRLILMAGCG